MGPITVTIWKESSIPYCLPSLYKEVVKDDLLKGVAVWIQKGADATRRLKWGKLRAKPSRREHPLQSTDRDRDLEKRNQISIMSSRVGKTVEGQNPVVSSFKVKEARQQPNHLTFSCIESGHASLWTAYVLATWGVHNAKNP